MSGVEVITFDQIRPGDHITQTWKPNGLVYMASGVVGSVERRYAYGANGGLIAASSRNSTIERRINK